MNRFSSCMGRLLKGRAFSRILTEEEGATSIEYGLIALLIAVAIVVVVSNLGGKVTHLFEITRDAYP